jgi:hypothetical protein
MASMTWTVKEWDSKTFYHPELFQVDGPLTASNDESGSQSRWKLSWNNTEQNSCALTLDGNIPGEFYVKDSIITVDGKPPIPVEEASFEASIEHLEGTLKSPHHSGEPGVIKAEADTTPYSPASTEPA